MRSFYGGSDQQEHRRKGHPCRPPSSPLPPVPTTPPHRHRPHGRPVADVPLAELVDAARSGCPGAWRAVVDRFDAGLHAVARGYGLDSASIDDAVQQTWLAAVTHLAALRESAALWGWLRRILHRECLRAVSRAHREVPVVEQELGDPVADRPRRAAGRAAASRRRTRRSATPRSRRCARRCAGCRAASSS